MSDLVTCQASVNHQIVFSSLLINRKYIFAHCCTFFYYQMHYASIRIDSIIKLPKIHIRCGLPHYYSFCGPYIYFWIYFFYLGNFKMTRFFSKHVTFSFFPVFIYGVVVMAQLGRSILYTIS